MAIPVDSTAQKPSETFEATQLVNAQKQQTFNQGVQDSVFQAADPAAWNKASGDLSVSNVQTTGKDSLYQDQSLPVGMSSLAFGDSAASQPSSDPMHQYMNDLSSVMNNSSSLLGDMKDWAQSNESSSTASQGDVPSYAAATVSNNPFTEGAAAPTSSASADNSAGSGGGSNPIESELDAIGQIGSEMAAATNAAGTTAPEDPIPVSPPGEVPYDGDPGDSSDSGDGY